MWDLKEKTKTNKQINETNNIKKRKRDTLPTQPVFPKDFSHAVYLFLSSNCINQTQTVYVMEQRYLLCAISF